MEPHTKALSSSCFYHIRSFKQIRSSLDDRMAVSVASALVSSRLDLGKFNLVRCSFEAYKSPSARPECTGKSRYLVSIHFSTLLHCITPNPPLATHWMASTFQTGHLGVQGIGHWPATLPVRTVTTLWTHTDSAIFLFFSTLCSTTQPWIWLAYISNLSTKNLEFIAW